MFKTVADFKKKLRNLEPGRELVYFSGELAGARERDATVNAIAAIALSVDDIGAGAVFQRRRAARGFDYVVRVFRRLGLRQDGNGTFQEATRVARLHEGRIHRSAEWA